LLAVASLLAWQVVAGNRGAREAHRWLQSGQLAQAEQGLRAVVRVAPWQHQARLDLAALLVADGRYDQAVLQLRSARRWATSQQGWRLEAAARAASGDLEGAIEVLERGTAALPLARAMQVERGELLLLAGRWREAAEACALALASQQQEGDAAGLRRRAWAGLRRSRIMAAR
jgi:tetratricopeptide (TPR) repeat protein